MAFFDLMASLVALGVLVPAGYLFWLTLWSARLPLVRHQFTDVRFDILVPAHNETNGIVQTVRNLSAVDYPPENRRIIVIADNCTDDTAAKAREAGALVLERQNAELRGKGYALEMAFKQSLAEGWASAVVVVDADSLVSPNLLKAFAARIQAGAKAIQAHYGVANPDASWRTRLMAIAFGMFHVLRSSARERLGLSCGLRGNGMCFTHALIREVPHEAFSVVEDVEYGIRLGRAWHRVFYAHEAHVLGEMVSSEKASRSQRQRWEGGRLKMAQAYGIPLLQDALRRQSGMLLDLALDILVPPLAIIAAAAGGGYLLTSLAQGLTRGDWTSVSLFGLSCFFVGVYVFRGWQLSETGLRGLGALAYAPVYVGWKVALLFMPKKRSGEWVRTTRESESQDPR